MLQTLPRNLMLALLGLILVFTPADAKAVQPVIDNALITTVAATQATIADLLGKMNGIIASTNILGAKVTAGSADSTSMNAAQLAGQMTANSIAASNAVSAGYGLALAKTQLSDRSTTQRNTALAIDTLLRGKFALNFIAADNSTGTPSYVAKIIAYGCQTGVFSPGVAAIFAKSGIAPNCASDPTFGGVADDPNTVLGSLTNFSLIYSPAVAGLLTHCAMMNIGQHDMPQGVALQSDYVHGIRVALQNSYANESCRQLFYANAHKFTLPQTAMGLRKINAAKLCDQNVGAVANAYNGNTPQNPSQEEEDTIVSPCYNALQASAFGDEIGGGAVANLHYAASSTIITALDNIHNALHYTNPPVRVGLKADVTEALNYLQSPQFQRMLAKVDFPALVRQQLAMLQEEEKTENRRFAALILDRQLKEAGIKLAVAHDTPTSLTGFFSQKGVQPTTLTALLQPPRYAALPAQGTVAAGSPKKQAAPPLTLAAIIR